ncbi:hypothetical protein MTR67_029301 [Solanum verrucosum]|uniref:Uncharacterized protein n=1 Tax=Solanum verrucosum TaxID=315347 RepID=A0AAF0TX55_SOLVR|nr:hypothetical protein MTR67_029301 [Solanum verrucosum]
MMEATVPRENQERVLFEKVNFGKEIMNIVACEGFRQLPLEQDIVKGVRAKVQRRYHKDFLVDEDGYWMLQGWKGRVIYALSCWKPVDN